MLNDTVTRQHAEQLAANGYCLIENITSDAHAEAALRPLGECMPQYDGEIRYQVKAAPGFEKRRYSKSTNEILVHTEAPGWDPPPRYLALHCRTQATCGSGHTEIADSRTFVASLRESDRRVLRDRAIDWVGHNTGGSGTSGVRRPVVDRSADGSEIFRFSYNLLTYGHYDPLINDAAASANLPLGEWGIHLAEQVDEFFRACRTSILIPECSILVWDNHRMLHARSVYKDKRRHLTRYWLAAKN